MKYVYHVVYAMEEIWNMEELRAAASTGKLIAPVRTTETFTMTQTVDRPMDERLIAELCQDRHKAMLDNHARGPRYNNLITEPYIINFIFLHN